MNPNPQTPAVTPEMQPQPAPGRWRGSRPLALGAAVLLAACAATGARLAYPPSPGGDVVDDYFGTKVADPYRWLEDLDSAQTRAWVQAQNALSRPLLDALPARPAIHRRLGELLNFERFGVPQRTPSGGLAYTRNDGLQNQSVLYFQEPGARPRILIDPNAWSADGTEAMADWKLSPDGRFVLYAVQSGGSDWVEYRVLEVATGNVLADRVRGVNFNFDFSRIFWRGGDSGFFYSRFPDPPASAPGSPPAITHQKIWFHRLGTDQKQDVMVYERPDQPTWFVWGEATDDGRYLLVYVERTEDTEKRLYVRDLGDPQRPRLDAPLKQLVGTWDGKYYLVGNEGPVFYLRTSAGASRYRIVAIDLRKPRAVREVVPESADVMQDARLIGGELVVSYLHDAASRLARFSTRGEPRGEIALPGLGSTGGLSGAVNHPWLAYSFASFARPATVYVGDLAAGKAEPFNPPRLAFNPDDYLTEQVFVRSKDGTRVPMFLSRRRDLPRAPAPTLLYGYGGFANALTPSFSSANLVWMERGGIYAQVGLRGGNEYGETWHQAGMLAQKQNVFDDFIAAAEFLIAERHTTAAQLAIRGRSNGGLLIGAVLNQRPDLFAAANAGVGVLDMLRYHKFGIAYAWAGDYGSSDTKEAFAYLRAYSPLHNVRAGVRFPATLITTAERDDRVHPLHSFKYTAALQAAQAGDAPVLIRIETRAGHGGGTALSKQIEENADVLAFFERYTRVIPSEARDRLK